MPRVPQDDVEAHIRSLHDAPTETIRRIGAPPMGARPTPRAEVPAPPPWEPEPVFMLSLDTASEQLTARTYFHTASVELSKCPCPMHALRFERSVHFAEALHALTHPESRHARAALSAGRNWIGASV
jgi:hypothetical protein